MPGRIRRRGRGTAKPTRAAVRRDDPLAWGLSGAWDFGTGPFIDVGGVGGKLDSPFAAEKAPFGWAATLPGTASATLTSTAAVLGSPVHSLVLLHRDAGDGASYPGILSTSLGPGLHGFGILRTPDGDNKKVYLEVTGASATIQTYPNVPANTGTDGAWHVTALTYDGATLIQYLDGLEVARNTGTAGTITTVTNGLSLGGRLSQVPNWVYSQGGAGVAYWWAGRVLKPEEVVTLTLKGDLFRLIRPRQYTYVPWWGAATTLSVIPDGIAPTGGAGSPTVALGTAKSVIPTGIAPTGAAGTPTVTLGTPLSASPTGIASTGALGTPTVTKGTALAVSPTGIASTAAVGTPTVDKTIVVGPSGIAPSGGVGQPTVTLVGGQVVTPTGIAPTGAAGTPTVSLGSALAVTPTGIAPSGGVGQPTLTKGSPWAVAPSGIASTASVGSPTVAIVTGLLVAPTGIAPTGAVGSPSVSLGLTNLVGPVGVAPSGGVGSPTVTKGTALPPITPAGIAPSGGVGQPTVSLTSGLAVTPDGIAPTGGVGRPTVTLTSGNLVVPEGIAPSGGVGQPTIVQGTTLSVAPLGIAPSGGVGAPRVVVEATLAVTPEGIASTGGVGSPTITMLVVGVTYVRPDGIAPESGPGEPRVVNVLPIPGLGGGGSRLVTHGLSGYASGLLTRGLGVAMARPTMPVGVPTTDVDLLQEIAERANATKEFAFVRAYSRPPRSDHTAEDYPALILFPDVANDLDQPSPSDSTRYLRFAVVVEVRSNEGDAISGPEAIRLATLFQDSFNKDRSFGGRCIGRFTRLSNATFDETRYPDYWIGWVGEVVYPRRRG